MPLSYFHGGHSGLADGKQVREIAEAAAAKDFLAFGFTEHFQMPRSVRGLPSRANP